MQTLKFDEFLRSLKQNKDTTHSLLLGAGASVESDVQTAAECIWDWKHDIFVSQNPSLIEPFTNVKIDNVRISIQRWLDNQNIYPKQDSDEEYSFYAERAYPIEEDRRKYFQHLTEGKKPSLGYHLISMLAETGWIKSVWSTNFDSLTLKAAHLYNLTPIEITLESQDRIYRNDVDKELLCIALHGDYKYGPLKNTAAELDVQSQTLISALKYELSKRNLIVIGYSGRDASLMSALTEAYTQPGAGRLYWCGYGSKCPQVVETFINTINANGRQAFYISTDGFDKTMLLIAKHCMSDNSEFLSRIEVLKASLGGVKDLSSTNFQVPQGNLRKIVKTNLYPIIFPKTCYQFKVSYLSDEKPWRYCKSLSDQGIIAVPHKGLIYAWGNKQAISDLCGNRIIGKIETTPFTRETLIQIGAFQDMLLRAIADFLGSKTNFSFSKNHIWDIQKLFSYNIGGKIIFAYEAVALSLVFDYKNTYLSFVPAFRFRDEERYEPTIRKQFADNFSTQINNGKPNLNIDKYTDKWVSALVGEKSVKGSFPVGSIDGFNFQIGCNSAIVGINSNAYSSKLALPQSIKTNRIIFNGIECRDPELLFYNSQQNKYVADFHPMRGLINNNPFDYSINNGILQSSINLGILCPQRHSQKFYNFLNELNNKHTVKYNADFVIPFQGFYNAYKVGLNIPVQDSQQWLQLRCPSNTETKIAALELAENIIRQLEQLSSAQIDVVLIYIPEEFEPLTSFSDELENFDLHNYVKAYAAQKKIATQFIREKTLVSDLDCQIMWALSLAIYVKSCRVPWTISGLQKDTAFAGIGYSINKSEAGADIVVGCSHVYSSDGQGLKYKLSKINDVTFDRKRNPYLTEDEAYRLGLNIKELFYKSFTELPKRVVIHKRTPFRQDEVNGLVKCLSSTGINDIELLEINYEDSLRCFEYDKNFQIDGFPVRRGLCFPLSNTTMLIYTHGIAPSVQNQYRKYVQGAKTIPLPLRVVKHYGNGNMAQIATEILGLSKMNWNSFGLYTKLPCTIESSNEIARIGRLLSQYEGSIYDYRFFM